MAKQSAKGGDKPIPRIEVSLDLSPEAGEELLKTLQIRFDHHLPRHRGMEWSAVRARLDAHPDKLRSLGAMERTGGEPDVIGYDAQTGEYIFCDCSPESPAGRRSICYDGEGQAAREKQGLYPAGNAIDLAAALGVQLLTEQEYRALQELGEFDTRTESWVKTPPDIRRLGGALFCDRRYGHVFVFHNSAPSFYAARGFRGSLRV